MEYRISGSLMGTEVPFSLQLSNLLGNEVADYVKEYLVAEMKAL